MNTLKSKIAYFERRKEYWERRQRKTDTLGPLNVSEIGMMISTYAHVITHLKYLIISVSYAKDDRPEPMEIHEG